MLLLLELAHWKAYITADFTVLVYNCKPVGNQITRALKRGNAEMFTIQITVFFLASSKRPAQRCRVASAPYLPKSQPHTLLTTNTFPPITLRLPHITSPNGRAQRGANPPKAQQDF